MSCSAFAQTSPERERGFKAEHVYDFNTVDSVSLFNGNLNLAIPLPSYPVASDVSYSFALRYSGNVWRDFERCGERITGTEHCTMNWRPIHDNAGLGWRLSFGELRGASDLHGPGSGASWRYVTADGGEHNFYKTLHEPVCTTSSNADCDRETAGVWYTRDGSYLRMKEVGTARIVEFPDGRRQRFFLEPVTSEWQLQYIYGASSQLDPNNGLPATNWVKFDYLPHDTTIVHWKITDSHGRLHQVTFQAGIHARTGIIDRIDLDGIGNLPARYELIYDTTDDAATADGTPSLLPRPYEGSTSDPVSVRLLTRLDLPGPGGETWRFRYDRGSGSFDSASGTMTQAVLPSLGKINWDYQEFPMWPASSQSTPVVGVLERWLGEPDNRVQRTRYTLSGDPHQRTAENLVPGPGGWRIARKTVSYFDSLGYAAHPTLSDGTQANRKLSTETYDCDPGNGICRLERQQYVRYEADALAGAVCHSNYPCTRDLNRRVVSERTVFVTDAGRYIDTDRSDFDGLGQYRITRVSDNFAGVRQRDTYVGYNTTTRDYNAQTLTGSSVGTYALTPAGARKTGYTMLTADDSWILSTYSTSSTSENEHSAHSEACFDPLTGFLRMTRTKRSSDGSPGPADLLTRYTRDTASGYASREEWFGGDGGSLPLSRLCTLVPAHDRYSYRVDRTFQHGVLTRSTSVDPATSHDLGFHALDQVVDRDTGRVIESRDVSGLATTYSYDSAQRLTRAQPPGMAATTYTYDTTSSPRAVHVATEASGGAVRSRIEFDPFGRVARTLTLLPETSAEKWSAVDVAYDALGRRGSVSEPYQLNAETPVFTHFEYDAFDRTKRVQAPDGSVTSFTYSGARERTRTSSVQTPSGTSDVLVLERYDAQGHLTELQERSGPADGLVRTTYQYDIAGRLTDVTMNGSEAERPVQKRSFVYDNLGLLRKEAHPEHDRIFYHAYDARGRAGLKVLENPDVQLRRVTAHDLRFTYDKAERLVLVEAQHPGQFVESFLKLKEFTYAQANTAAASGVNYTKGKLLTAARWNYAPDTSDPEFLVYKVTERYGYADAAGRKTDRTTLIEQGRGGVYDTVREVKQAVAYNDLGLPSMIRYPACVNCTYPFTREVTAQYDQGKLARLDRVFDESNGITTNLVAELAYWPNGMTKSVLHGNLMTDWTDTDSTARPKRIRFASWQVCAPPGVTISASSYAAGAGQSVTLTAVPSGTAPFTYQWLSKQGSDMWRSVAAPDGQAISLTVTPALTTSYKVEIRNACNLSESGAYGNTVVSAPATISVDSCAVPVVETQPVAQQTVPSGAAVTLRVTATGTAPLAYAWHAVGNPSVVIGSGSTLTLSSVTQTTSYACRITNSCGEATSSTATVVVPLPQPTNLVATRSGAGSASLVWTAAPGAHHYNVERRSHGGGFAVVGTATGTSHTDAGLATGATYVYRVVAVDASGGSASLPSNPDLATMMSFSTVTAGMFVDDDHFHELLAAMNALQTAAGMPAHTWTTILPAGTPAPGSGVPVQAAHTAALRTRIDSALQALGLSSAAYLDDPLGTGQTTVKAAHITALQQRAR